MPEKLFFSKIHDAYVVYLRRGYLRLKENHKTGNDIN